MTHPTDIPKDFDARWSGIDSSTPDGHMLSLGVDSLGRTVTFLFEGTDPATARRLGGIVQIGDRVVFVIGRRNAAIAWSVRSFRDGFDLIIADGHRCV